MKYGIALILVTFAASASAFADEGNAADAAPRQELTTAPDSGSETAPVTYAYTTEAVVEFPQSALVQ